MKILELILATCFACACAVMIVPDLVNYAGELHKWYGLELATCLVSIGWVGRSAMALRAF